MVLLFWLSAVASGAVLCSSSTFLFVLPMISAALEHACDLCVDILPRHN